MAFRSRGSRGLPDSVREVFWESVRSGLSPTAAATVAGVCGATGRQWAKVAGHKTNPKHHGIRYSTATREAFWAVMQGGASVTEASVITGVPEHRGQAWVTQAGYVPRTPTPALSDADPLPPKGPLSFLERCRLEELLEAGHRRTAAAVLMGRHRDTINREITRGLTGSGYRAWAGQQVVEANRRRPKARKLQANPVLLAEVVARLRRHDSPEQIAGRLRLDFPNDPEMWVSHETIYQALYVQPRGELARLVKQALRSGRVQRKTQGRNSVDRNRFKAGMIGIADRPAEAKDRAIPGHWESQWCCQAA
jgi:IS30 family transposase